MKFRKATNQEIELINKIVDGFKGNFDAEKFFVFVDKFNKVYIYNGNFNLNSANIMANIMSAGLYAGKFKDNEFIPSDEFIDIIKPKKYVFEIEDKDNAIRFMKGQDISNEAGKYIIHTSKKLDFEENSLIAVKYKHIFLGIGRFNNKIVNKISKRRKIH